MGDNNDNCLQATALFSTSQPYTEYNIIFMYMDKDNRNKIFFFTSPYFTQ